MDLKEVDILGEKIGNHWYYRSKTKAVSQLLKTKKVYKILDVGAGSGFFSKYLLSHSQAKEAWCVDISYDNDSEALEAGKPLYFRRSINTIDADLVLLMDVLEHVDDDVALLKDYVDKVPKGTLFLISVPAFDILWSGHDEFLGHKRRYTLRQLEDVVKLSTLDVKKGVYYFAVALPIAAAIRGIDKLFSNNSQPPKAQLKQHHPIINGALDAFSGAEVHIMKFNRFAGLTIICLAEKI